VWAIKAKLDLVSLMICLTHRWTSQFKNFGAQDGKELMKITKKHTDALFKMRILFNNRHSPFSVLETPESLSCHYSNFYVYLEGG